MKPKDFAQQINLNMDNCWGIVRALVDLCMKQEDGKYLLVKDPNKQLLRLYSVPEDAFQVGAGCTGQALCRAPMPDLSQHYNVCVRPAEYWSATFPKIKPALQPSGPLRKINVRARPCSIVCFSSP